MKFRSPAIALFLAAVAGFSAIGLLGCATESTVDDLESMVWDGRHSTMWKGTFYCGTKGGYHYFCHRMELRQDAIFKISELDLDIAAVRKYPLPRQDWIAVRDLGIDGAPH